MGADALLVDLAEEQLSTHAPPLILSRVIVNQI
jgi:hypothetical protein